MGYGMHLRFHSPRIRKIGPTLKRIMEGIVYVTDLLGGYSQQKHYGLATWKQSGEDWLKPYEYSETIKFNHRNRLYRPWHMDFFDWQGKRYCVVQTNQCNADIVLAISDDNKHFTFFNKPLITNKTIGKMGIYKPCAGVTPNGTFFLYYTAQDANNRAMNRLYLTTMPYDEMIGRLENN
jgi:hypothetical protein